MAKEGVRVWSRNRQKKYEEEIVETMIAKFNEIGIMMRREDYQLYSFEFVTIGDHFLTNSMPKFDFEVFEHHTAKFTSVELAVALGKMKEIEGTLSRATGKRDFRLRMVCGFLNGEVKFVNKDNSQLKRNPIEFKLKILRESGRQKQFETYKLKAAFSPKEAEEYLDTVLSSWNNEYSDYGLQVGKEVRKEIDRILREARIAKDELTRNKKKWFN